MKKFLLIVFLSSCTGIKDLNKKKTIEELNKIIPVKLEENKMYSVKVTIEQLENIYKDKAVKLAEEEMEEIKEYFNTLNIKEGNFIEYFKESYKNEVPISLQEKLSQAIDEKEIMDILITKNLNIILSERVYIFKTVKNVISIYPIFSYIPEWHKIGKNSWNTHGIEEKIENGIYFIDNQPFQIIEIKNITELDPTLETIKKNNIYPIY